MMLSRPQYRSMLILPRLGEDLPNGGKQNAAHRSVDPPKASARIAVSFGRSPHRQTVAETGDPDLVRIVWVDEDPMRLAEGIAMKLGEVRRLAVRAVPQALR